MSVEHRAYRAAGVESEPWFFDSPGVAEGHVYVLGPYGDHNPGAVLEDGVIEVDGGEDLFIARTLTEAISGVARYPVPATAGKLELVGQVDTLVCYNAQGSGGATTFKAHAKRTPKRNSGDPPGHPGHGEAVVRATPVADAATVFTLIATARIRLTALKTWTKVPASGASCVLTASANGKNLLAAANVNVAGLTTVTLQSHTLTATADDLILDAFDEVTLTITGGAGLTPGDLVVALAHELL